MQDDNGVWQQEDLHKTHGNTTQDESSMNVERTKVSRRCCSGSVTGRNATTMVMRHYNLQH